jgi:hypothetical protein
MDIDGFSRPIGRRALFGAAAWLLLARAPACAATLVTVYKDPT